MRAEINKERHCEGVYLPNRQVTTEAIRSIRAAREVGCSTTGLLRAYAHSFASARNDVKPLIIDN